jgi:hypothetical protein
VTVLLVSTPLTFVNLTQRRDTTTQPLNSIVLKVADIVVPTRTKLDPTSVSKLGVIKLPNVKITPDHPRFAHSLSTVMLVELESSTQQHFL